MVRLGVVLLAMGALGCWQTPPLAISHEGCDLYTNAEEPFSAALPEACATFRDLLEVELDATRPDARPIAMSVWAERSEVQIDCPARASACAIPLHTSSVIPLDLHELVHAHLGTIATANALFAEGIAMVYGCEDHVDPIEPALTEAWLTNDEAFYAVPEGGSYWSAASFVAYLIDRFGAPRFFAFYRVARTDSLEVLDQRAIDVLGVSIRDLVATWSSLGPVTSASVCRPILACSAPALRSPETLTLARGVARTQSRYRAGAIRTFEVVGEARTTVTLEGALPSFQIVTCDGAPGEREGGSTGNRVETRLDLPPGRYAIWAEVSPPDDVAEVTAVLRVE